MTPTPQNSPSEASSELREKLAAIEHERWADWQKWVHSRLTPVNNLGMLMSPEDYQHWEEQIAADYSELSPAEQASDLEQVDRYWPLLEAAIARLLLEAKIDTANHLHRNQGENLPKRDYDNDTDEYICDVYIAALKSQLKDMK